MGPAFDSRLTHSFCFSSECFRSFEVLDIPDAFDVVCTRREPAKSATSESSALPRAGCSGALLRHSVVPLFLRYLALNPTSQKQTSISPEAARCFSFPQRLMPSLITTTSCLQSSFPCQDAQPVPPFRQPSFKPFVKRSLTSVSQDSARISIQTRTVPTAATSSSTLLE